MSFTALADALLQGLTDQELRDRLRAAGFVRAAAFSWEETAARTLEIYQALR